MNFRAGRYRFAAAVVALILTGGACSTPVDTTAAPEENVGFDPVSLSDLAGVGGSSSLPMTNEEVARQSQIAIEAVVKDVRPSRLNT
ncbi:MAG: hypothetical protein IIC71_14345 [Acidobacteria bacterium]|nr:hypothetical protein [Acidobacteriota bacterium]